MNTPRRTLYLALFLASTPFPATTAASSPYEVAYEDNDNEEIIDTEASTPKKKAKSKKRTKDNWSKRAQQIGLAVVVAGVLIFGYQYRQGKKNDDNNNNNNNNENKNDEKNDDKNKNDKNKNKKKNNNNDENNNENENDEKKNDPLPPTTYKELLRRGQASQNVTGGNSLLTEDISGGENASTFQALLQNKVTNDNTKDKAEGKWQTWIVQKDQDLLNALEYIFFSTQWNITKAEGESAEIEKFITGLIDGEKVSSLEAGYALAHILHFIQNTIGETGMKTIVAHNNHKFLAQLVSIHTSNTLNVAQKNNASEKNILPSILVTCIVGGANPTAQPSFGSNDKDPFYNNAGDDAKTIQKIALREKGANNRLAFKQQNNKPWTVEPLGNDADNDNSKQP